jgi:endonuclease VIII
MPEGPSIVIAKDEMKQFIGKKVIDVSGNSKIDQSRILNQKVIDIKSWGKHLLICFKDFTVRIHFLLFGTYRVNETKPSPVRLHLGFKNGELNFYAAAIIIINEDLDEIYDWSADVMSDQWDPAAAEKKLKNNPDMLACDALLDQQIFSGSGNIIKNEVLFRVRIHPLSNVGALPKEKRKELVYEVRNYSFQFLEWKKAFVLRKHWLAHTKRICPRCNIPLIKEYLGRTNRRTFYCANCQELYKCGVGC